MRKKAIALLAALAVLALGAVPALAEITVTKKDLAQNTGLDKNVSNILVLMQDGGATDAMMIASINSRTGRSVMTRVDCAREVEIPEAGTVQLQDVYMLGAEKSRGLLVARTLNQLLNLNIGTYVALDITSLPALVDVVDYLYFELSDEEAAALGLEPGGNDLEGEEVLAYVRLKLDSDSPARSRGYDALMQLLYQGLHSGNVMDMMGLGSKLLASMDTNLNVMQAVTLASAVQAGTDRREVLIDSAMADGEAAALLQKEIYE